MTIKRIGTAANWRPPAASTGKTARNSGAILYPVETHCEMRSGDIWDWVSQPGLGGEVGGDESCGIGTKALGERERGKQVCL